MRHVSLRTRTKLSASVSFARTGLRLSIAERKSRKAAHTRAWIKNHPEEMKQFDEAYKERRARNNAKRRRKLRLAVIKKLGGRCASPTCRWVNEDGSRGCTDIRVLQADHVKGGGTQERNKLHVERMWRKILVDIDGNYQALCSNCNWIKAHEQKEFRTLYSYAEVA